MAAKKTPRGLTHRKGLGNRHRLWREGALRALVDGSSCELCDLPRFRDPAMNHDQMALEADHVVPRAIAGPRALPSRLVHASCNRRAGAILGNALRRERGDDGEPRGRLAFAWP
jgi:hypothetical protein